jgi:hypothetical protein
MPRIIAGYPIADSCSNSHGPRQYVAKSPSAVRRGGIARCWEMRCLAGAGDEQAIDTVIRGWLGVDLWDRRDAEIEAARRLL